MNKIYIFCEKSKQSVDIRYINLLNTIPHLPIHPEPERIDTLKRTLKKQTINREEF